MRYLLLLISVTVIGMASELIYFLVTGERYIPSEWAWLLQ